MTKGKKHSLAAGIVVVVSLIYCLSMIFIFVNNFIMTKDTMMEDTDELLWQKVYYYDSVVTGWLDTRLEHINILKNTFENMDKADLTEDVVLDMLTESTNYGYELGVISDYVVYPNDKMICGDGWIPDADYTPTVNDYYQMPANSGELYISTPYVDATTGEFIITLSVPVYQKDKLYFVLARDLYIDEIRAITEEYENKEGAYLYILDNEKNILSHKNPEYAPSGEMVHNVEECSEVPFIGTLSESNQVYRGTDYDGEGKCFVEYQNERTGWIIGLSYPQQVNTNRLKDILIQGVKIAVVALIVSIVVLFVFIQAKLKPVKSLVKAAQKIEQGDLDIRYDIRSNDEIGQLAETFQNTTNYLRNIIGEIAELLTKMAGGNLVVETRNDYRGEFEIIRQAIGNVSGNLNEIIGGIRQLADQVADSSEQMAQGSQQLAISAQTQAEQVGNLVESCKHITQSVNDNSEKCQNAGMITAEVAEKLEISNRQMKEMLDAMERISDSSKQIGAVNKTIEDIAFQTNILALNAAVEAARVGEAGKGFAVVADEVRSLAAKSTEAAQNTTELISESINVVDRGSEISDFTAESLKQVVEISQQVYRTIQDIVERSEEQATEVSHMAEGIQEISEQIQMNSATAEESAASSEELSSQAQMMRNLVSQFTTL